MLDHRMKADPKPFCDLPQIEWVKSPGLDTGAPRADGIRAEDKIGFQIEIVPADGTKADVEKWTADEWDAVKAKWSKENAKWAACEQQATDQKLSGRTSWVFIYKCLF